MAKGKSKYAKKSTKYVRVLKPDVVATKQLIKQALSTEIETKTINVPDPVTPATNTVHRLYLQGSGLQYLVVDAYKQLQGTANSTVIGNPIGNRIGDKVKAVGILMDYFFHSRSSYSIGSNSYHIPFVKVRVTLFTQAYGVSLPTLALLYDSEFVAGGGASLRPVDYSEGNARRVLYDRVHIIENRPADPLSAGGPNSPSPTSAMIRFRKYIKLDKFIKYMDSNSGNPNGTQNPIYMTVYAEVDDGFTGLVPSGTTLLYMTGRTQCWFKDA